MRSPSFLGLIDSDPNVLHANSLHVHLLSTFHGIGAPRRAYDTYISWNIDGIALWLEGVRIHRIVDYWSVVGDNRELFSSAIAAIIALEYCQIGQEVDTVLERIRRWVSAVILCSSIDSLNDSGLWIPSQPGHNRFVRSHPVNGEQDVVARVNIFRVKYVMGIEVASEIDNEIITSSLGPGLYGNADSHYLAITE